MSNKEQRTKNKEQRTKNKPIVTISYGYRIPVKHIEVATCVIARYYKGFSNYNPENAVIIVK